MALNDMLYTVKKQKVSTGRSGPVKVPDPTGNRQRRSSRPPNPPIGGGPGQLYWPKLV